MSWYRGITVCIAAIQFFAGQRLAAGGGLPPDAITNWQKVVAACANSHLQFAVKRATSSGDVESLVTFKARGDCRVLITETNESDGWVGEVWATNTKYNFRLKRPDRDRSWVISGVEMPSGQERVIDHRLGASEGALHYHPLAANHVSVLDIAMHPSFSVTSSKPLVEDGRELQEYEFQIDRAAGPRSDVKFGFDCGTLVLDPHLSWLPVRIRLGSSTGRNSLTFEKSEFREYGGVPVPMAVSWHGTSAEGKVSRVSTTVVELAEIGEPGPSEGDFTLSAFGLPEPLGMESQSIPAYLWALGAGVGLIVMGLAARWWSRARGAT